MHSGISALLAEFVSRMRMLHGAAVLYSKLLSNVMRQPQRFFDTTPIGRVLSRFSKDTDAIDVTLPFSIFDLIFCLMDVSLKGLLVFAIIPKDFLFQAFT